MSAPQSSRGSSPTSGALRPSGTPRTLARVSGLDLAAEERNCSGYALIDLHSMSLARVECLYSDEQIVSSILSDGVGVVSMDSPITKEPRLRSLDREMVRMGFRVLPPSFAHMRKLATRGWRLYERLAAEGVVVIETHPRSALKSSGAGDCFELARSLGVDLGIYGSRALRRDLRDAIVSAIVALCYVRGDCLLTISAEDGSLYLVKSLHS